MRAGQPHKEKERAVRSRLLVDVRYRIVGPDEFDPEKGYISMDSPVAKALMKKTLDDEVIVETPKGRIVYYVVSIRYK